MGGGPQVGGGEALHLLLEHHLCVSFAPRTRLCSQAAVAPHNRAHVAGPDKECASDLYAPDTAATRSPYRVRRVILRVCAGFDSCHFTFRGPVTTRTS